MIPPYCYLSTPHILYIYSALVLTKDKSTIYCCIEPDLYQVTKFIKCEKSKTWKKVADLPRAHNDDTEIMLQLKLDKHDKVLFGESI